MDDIGYRSRDAQLRLIEGHCVGSAMRRRCKPKWSTERSARFIVDLCFMGYMLVSVIFYCELL